jgi:hypothetical protein
MLTPLFSKTITTIGDLTALLTELHKQDRMFHCEDDPADIGIFTAEEADLLNTRMEEAYRLRFPAGQCPCFIALDIMKTEQPTR